MYELCGEDEAVGAAAGGVRYPFSHLLLLLQIYIFFSKGSFINHVATKGGRGVGKMFMFVYVGGRGVESNVHIAFFHNF